MDVLISETRKLLGSTVNKIRKNKNGKNGSHLEITEVALVQCNIVNNDYQHDSKVLYTFVRNKPFGNLLEIAITFYLFIQSFLIQSFHILKYVYRSKQSLETEDRINLTLVMK